MPSSGASRLHLLLLSPWALTLRLPMTMIAHTAGAGRRLRMESSCTFETTFRLHEKKL